MSDDDAALAGLVDDLRALGRSIGATPRPDLADRVLAALDPPPAADRVAWWSVIRRPVARWSVIRRPVARRAGARRAVALVALALLVVAGGVAVASPPVRAAIRHLFAGVEIHHGAPPPPAVHPSLPGEHPTDLAGASREVGFAVLVPAALGPPDRVTVADGRVVSLFWHRAPGDVRLDEFAGDLGVMFEKYALGRAVRTTVNGAPALWFTDGTTIEYLGADGRVYPESTRPTGRTLIWTVGRVTLRLDGVPTMAAAVALAATA